MIMSIHPAPPKIPHSLEPQENLSLSLYISLFLSFI